MRNEFLPSRGKLGTLVGPLLLGEAMDGCAHQGGRWMSGLYEASPSASSPVPQFPCPAQAVSTRDTSIRARRPSDSKRVAAVFTAPARYSLAVSNPRSVSSLRVSHPVFILGW